MTEDSILLTQAIRSSLCDKSADRRKQGATDIEVAVRGLVRLLHPNHSASIVQVVRLIRCLVEEYCKSAFTVRRKGGLISLATIAIALQHNHVQTYVHLLLPPVLDCFDDEEAGVRYHACEAFYNIAKVARCGVLGHFGDIFDGLCRLYADVDQVVKDGVQCVDRLVRDIVTESRTFSYSDFIPMLTTRIRVLNPCVRQLVLGWIVLLDSVPQVDMIVYLPQFLEALFGILASDNRDIRHSAEVFLSELLSEVKTTAADRPARARRATAGAAPAVARCCRAGERRPEDNYVRLRALHWLLELVRLQTEIELGGGELEGIPESPTRRHPTTSFGSPGPEPALGTLPRWVTSGLQLNRVSCLGASTKTNSGEEGLQYMLPVLLAGALHCVCDAEGEIRQQAEQANEALQRAAQCLGANVPVEAIVEALLVAMRDAGAASSQQHGKIVPLKCLSWAQLLLGQSPARFLEPGVRDRVIDAALSAVVRPEDEVAVAVLRLLACIVAAQEASNASTTCVAADCEASQPPAEKRCLLSDVCRKLFRLMAGDDALLRKRGELAVRQLCDGVGAERFYATVAGALAAEEDGAFAQRLVRVLHRTLLTSRETRWLRMRLRRDAALAAEPADNCELGTGTGGALPMELLVAWFRCPVCTLGLALWLHWFEFASAIARRLVAQEIPEDLMAQLEDLADIMESPIFARVRLQLLESRQRPAPLRVVLALVTVGPNTRAVTALNARLEIVATALLLDKVRGRETGDRPSAGAAAGGGEAGEPWVAGSLNRGARSGQHEVSLARFDRVVLAHGWRKASM